MIINYNNYKPYIYIWWYSP